MNQMTITPQTTVHDYAEWFRKENRETPSPSNFDLPKMEEIAQTTPDIRPDNVFNAVRSVVEQIDDPLIFGLGVCWLDQKGYAGMPMHEVLRLRGGQPPVL